MVREGVMGLGGMGGQWPATSWFVDQGVEGELDLEGVPGQQGSTQVRQGLANLIGSCKLMSACKLCRSL